MIGKCRFSVNIKVKATVCSGYGDVKKVQLFIGLVLYCEVKVFRNRETELNCCNTWLMSVEVMSYNIKMSSTYLTYPCILWLVRISINAVFNVL
jgi:hypothetical protein